MNCEKFKTVIKEFIAGELSETEHEHCGNHIAECESCLTLWSALVESELDHSIKLKAGFSQSILQDVGLDACQQSEAMLCDYLELKLDPLQTELLKNHLQDCENCQATQVSLQILDAELGALAEISPSPNFIKLVLAQTLEVEPAESILKRLTGIDFQALFVQLMRRPRFPIEAAFAATVLWTSFFGVPTGIVFSAQADALPLVSPEVVQERIEDFQSNVNAGMDSIPVVVSEQFQNFSTASRSFLEDRRDASQQNRIALRESITNWYSNSIFNFSVDD
ncbi:MAG: hypothetical protein GKR91_10140 [Pseudomonadales bacterium]|nr:hypothetical protein [Pseudomonadales bacterium]